MGKRELLIVCAFAVVGIVVYQFAAPPAKPGQRDFSIGQIFDGIKKEISANAASAKVDKTGAFAVTENVSELRVTTPRSVPLTVIGEDRKDISYELPVVSTGPDEQTAREWANKSEVRRDDLGAALALSVYFPEEGTQRATLTVRVPARFAVRAENSGVIKISQVAAVDLRNPTGEVTLTDISGPVTGAQRSGELEVMGAGSVDVGLSSSRSKFRKIKGTTKINARNGECSIAESGGAIEVTATNVELTINATQNPIKVTGDGGELKVFDAHDLSVDARRMAVELETTLGAQDRITVLTSDEPVRVLLGGTPSFVLDAVNNGGTIRASDFKLEPAKDGRESKVTATIGSGGARLVLRNARRDIVIGLRK